MRREERKRSQPESQSESQRASRLSLLLSAPGRVRLFVFMRRICIKTDLGWALSRYLSESEQLIGPFASFATHSTSGLKTPRKNCIAYALLVSREISQKGLYIYIFHLSDPFFLPIHAPGPPVPHPPPSSFLFLLLLLVVLTSPWFFHFSPGL